MFFEETQFVNKRVKKKLLASQVFSTLHRIRITPNLMSDAELLRLPVGSVFVFDVESYPNYFCVSFKHVDSGKVVCFEDSPDTSVDLNKLRFMLWHFCLVGFNSISYDMPIVALVCNGFRASDLHFATLQIIQQNYRPSDIEREWKIEIPSKINHIDLIEVAPLDASLKLYAGRLHCNRMQDLPYRFDLHLSKEQAEDVLHYNINDLDNTELLYRELCPQLELRESLGAEYGLDLRSRSDAQIAESIITSELTKLNGVRAKRPNVPEGLTFQYNVPSYIQYQTPALQAALDVVRGAVFVVDGNGAPVMPDALKTLAIRLGGSTYQMGIGGLHSTEKCAAHKASDTILLLDRDVASYYPAIVLNQGLYPRHLGPGFLDVYRSIVDRRLAAKKAGNKIVADSLKITINGSFGKLGDKYSKLYAPDLLLQVTITGQLTLLMLIEMIELAGISVVSGNTDGIVIKCSVHDREKLNAIIAEWERITNFVTEETEYAAIYSRDVNNYIAVKKDGKCKVKGVYSEVGSALNSVLSKNPETLILSDAVQALISKNTPIEKTIYDCKDIRRFVSVKRANGGAHKDGVYLGKVIRWYYAENISGQINYVTNGNAIGKSEGGKPLMDLPPEFPSDINYDWYINAANDMLYDIGYYGKKQASLF